MRYEGTDCAMMTSPHGLGSLSLHALLAIQPGKENLAAFVLPSFVTPLLSFAAGAVDFSTEFVSNYQREFGFTLKDRGLIVDDIRVRAVAHSPQPQPPLLAEDRSPPKVCLH
jgi:hypothetical protein